MKRGVVMAAALVLIVAVSIGYQYRWYKLDYYIPENDIRFAANIRTMAQHDVFMQDKEWPYLLRIDPPGDGELVYYGSWHTTDPDDPQIAEIEREWAALEPTVAVTENRLGFFVGGMRQGIKMFAEFGAAFALARRDEIPIYSLEPPWEVEVAEMKSQFPTEDVVIFYTLRVFLHERGAEGDRDKIDELAADLLAKRGSRPGLEGSVPDLDAFDAAWNARFADLGDWRVLSPEAIHPSSRPQRLNALANLANEIRDRHAARVIIDLLQKGERVFAVAGGSHVVKQEPVLHAAFSP